MSETITVRGFLGGDVEEFTTVQGLPISNFRLGCTPRRYDRKTERWVNGETNWYTVSAFRQLAQNVKSSLRKGDPVVVTGRLRVRQWENEKGQRGTSVEIDAEAVGYDLTFGTGSFTRLGSAASPEENHPSAEESSSDADTASFGSGYTGQGLEGSTNKESSDLEEKVPF